MTLAPVPNFPERMPQAFQRVQAPSIPGNKGPLSHEEGIALDTDRPNDFMQGAFVDTSAQAGTISRPNPEAQFKHANQTMQERAHIGSATWVEAPTMLGDFMQGAGAGQSMPQFEQVNNPGTRQMRRGPAIVRD